MVVIQSDNRRIIRKIAGQRWEVGVVREPVLLKHYGGFDDLSTAIFGANQCVLRTLLGMDQNAFMFAPSNEPTFDDDALRQFRKMKKSISESIDQARDENQYDLVEIYEKELNELNEATANDLISSFKSRPLDGGDPIKNETHAIRQRKRRALNAFREVGLQNEAEDLDRCYTVTSRSVVFYSRDSDYQWIVEGENVSAA